MKLRFTIPFVALATFLSVSTLHAQDVTIPPAPKGTKVLDLVDILTPAQEAEIDTVVNALDMDLQTQFAVLTMDDCGGSITVLRTEVFEAWGIGHDNSDRGLLILICMYSQEPNRRAIGQEVGYGLEGDIPDITTVHYREKYFIPHAKQGEFGAGVVSLVHAYDDLLRGVLTAIPEEGMSLGLKIFIFIFIVCLILLILLVVFASSSSGNRSYSSSDGSYDSSVGSYTSSDSGGSFSSSDSGGSDFSSSDSGGSDFGGGDSGGGGSDGGF